MTGLIKHRPRPLIWWRLGPSGETVRAHLETKVAVATGKVLRTYRKEKNIVLGPTLQHRTPRSAKSTGPTPPKVPPLNNLKSGSRQASPRPRHSIPQTCKLRGAQIDYTAWHAVASPTVETAVWGGVTLPTKCHTGPRTRSRAEQRRVGLTWRTRTRRNSCILHPTYLRPLHKVWRYP